MIRELFIRRAPLHSEGVLIFFLFPELLALHNAWFSFFISIDEAGD
jgi:hypothetical protein